MLNLRLVAIAALVTLAVVVGVGQYQGYQQGKQLADLHSRLTDAEDRADAADAEARASQTALEDATAAAMQRIEDATAAAMQRIEAASNTGDVESTVSSLESQLEDVDARVSAVEAEIGTPSPLDPSVRGELDELDSHIANLSSCLSWVLDEMREEEAERYTMELTPYGCTRLPSP